MHALLRRIAIGLLMIALAVGCARSPQPTLPESLQAAAPAASQPAAAEPAPSGYTLLINGQEAAPGTTVEADFSAPVELLLQFPVPVDQATVEPLRKRLPEGTILTWPDERTAHLLVWRQGSFTVDATGIRSQDGKAEVKGAAPVQVRREPHARATLYRVEDLLAGKREFVSRWRLPYRPTGFVLSPDRTKALLFSADPMVPGPAPSLLDLQTGENRSLGQEPGAYPIGGWLPDGRLYLAESGGALRLSADGGQTWQATATGRFGWVSRLSPQGSQIAYWDYPRTVTVVDVNTGAKQELAGPFRRPAQDGAPNLAWSPDGQWLAGSDFDSDADGSGARIRLVDPAGTRPSPAIEGVSLVAWLPDGRLLGWRRAAEPKRPEEGELLLIDPAGGELLLLNHWARPSPDGRYLAYTEWGGQMPVSYLVEVASGTRTRVPPIDLGQWTAEGELLVIEGPF